MKLIIMMSFITVLPAFAYQHSCQAFQTSIQNGSLKTEKAKLYMESQPEQEGLNFTKAKLGKNEISSVLLFDPAWGGSLELHFFLKARVGESLHLKLEHKNVFFMQTRTNIYRHYDWAEQKFTSELSDELIAKNLLSSGKILEGEILEFYVNCFGENGEFKKNRSLNAWSKLAHPHPVQDGKYFYCKSTLNHNRDGNYDYDNDNFVIELLKQEFQDISRHDLDLKVKPLGESQEHKGNFDLLFLVAPKVGKKFSFEVRYAGPEYMTSYSDTFFNFHFGHKYYQEYPASYEYNLILNKLQLAGVIQKNELIQYSQRCSWR